MNTSDVHKKKRQKNLLLLALILAWCALIWAITMIKMARAEDMVQPVSTEAAASVASDVSIAHEATSSAWPAEVPASGEVFAAQRETHLQEVSDTTQEYQEAGLVHQAEVEEQRKSWWENWIDKVNPEK